MPAPQKIKELVERFAQNYDYYQSAEYNEEGLRHDFLNPFFKELGWDMEDERKLGPRRDVHYEERTKVGAPDFGFYVDEKRRFFVEAKNPSVNVCGNVDAAHQLRSYGWSAKHPRNILTDFEELAIYDCTVRPKAGDDSRVARLDCIKYTQYVERWDEIASLFSRDAVATGSLEKLEKEHAKQAVDDDFLEDISRWREILAKNIALRNKRIAEEQLNRAVQDTLDRIIFLRICEDRNIESSNRLRELSEQKKIYVELLKIFRKANERYDSSLFKVGSEEDILIDDEALKIIISELYFPQSPYKFDAISADILGKVYEQFLGKVIRLTAGHHVKIEEKPEVRRAGGVYYTPPYIVEYIVKNTVGKLLDGKNPKAVANFSVLDPACGSGSFLIGAYQYLMDWYRDWYASHDAVKYAKKRLIYQDDDNQWQVTLEERKRILAAHIYGVDIDRQAVEVTKLSLMLKALEAPEQRSLFNDRLLPELDKNIKCGNSLIGTDYFSDQTLPDPAERKHVNPFDWDGKDAFPEIIKRGGFDVVIGNPPYNAALNREEKRYLQTKYESVKAGRQDTAAIFVELGLYLSNRVVMYLLPYRLISRKRNHGPFQVWLYENCGLRSIIYLGKIKEIGANDEFMIVSLKKRRDSDLMQVAQRASRQELENDNIKFSFFKQDQWGPPNYDMNIHFGEFDLKLLRKVDVSSIKLGDIAESRDGIVPFIREKMVSETKKDNRYKPLLGIRGYYSLGRYYLKWGGIYVCYDIGEAKKYIKDKVELRKVQLRDEQIFLYTEKILTAQDSSTIKGTLDTQKFYVTNSIHTTYLKPAVKYNIRFILGLVNSRLINYYYKSLVRKGQDLHPQVLVGNLPKLPIHRIDFEKQNEKIKHDAIVGLVDQMLNLNLRLQITNSAQECTALQRQIDATDCEIDKKVYELYGLSDGEIKIIEDSFTK